MKERIKSTLLLNTKREVLEFSLLRTVAFITV